VNYIKDEETDKYMAQERRNAYRLWWESVSQMNPVHTLILLIHPYHDSKVSSPQFLRGVFKTHYNILLHVRPRQSGWFFKFCG